MGRRHPKFDEREFVKEMLKIWKSSRRVGAEAAAHTLTELYYRGISPDLEKDIWAMVVSADESMRPEAEYAQMVKERTWYGMTDVRRDLNVDADAKLKRILKPKS